MITFYVSANCYKRVKDETTELQEIIEKELGLKPIEQEVVVLYKGERTKKPEEFWNVRHTILKLQCTISKIVFMNLISGQKNY